jgi:hypothetical protein
MRCVVRYVAGLAAAYYATGFPSISIAFQAGTFVPMTQCTFDKTILSACIR